MVNKDYRAGHYLRTLAEIAAILLVSLAASSSAQSQEIRVRFLDGQTGRPVTYEAAQMWVGTGTRLLLAPAKNKEGTATFLYTGHSIRAVWPPNTKVRNIETEVSVALGSERIAVAPTVATDICWDMGPSHIGPWYPVSEILQHGAVSENRCGKATAKAEPGELILFIKPLSIWRRLLEGFRS
jgi:hypothetical protein